MQIYNFCAENNPWQVDMPLKSMNKNYDEIKWVLIFF